MKKQFLKEKYVSLLKRYTTISFTDGSADQDVDGEISGKFINGIECSIYRAYKNVYAIRFSDKMTSAEFEQVFDLLKNDLGNPDFFYEYEGYVWKREGYSISFGFVSLNYNYEVPMICVIKRIGSLLFTKISYDKYSAMANAINKPLNERGKYPAVHSYFPINYTREFGAFVMVDVSTGMLNISYKNGKLALGFSAFKPYGEYRIVDSENSFKKELKAVSILKLQAKLESLLDETKEYHRLEK